MDRFKPCSVTQIAQTIRSYIARNKGFYSSKVAIFNAKKRKQSVNLEDKVTLEREKKRANEMEMHIIRHRFELEDALKFAIKFKASNPTVID